MLVLVFDTSISAEVEDPDYFFDEEDSLEWKLRPGVVQREGGKFDEDPIAQSALPLGATWWPVLAELRELAETGEMSVVLVTTDFRLLGEGGLSLTHAAHEAGLAPSTAHHHLVQLVDAGLAVRQRKGRQRIYKWGSTRASLHFEHVPSSPASSA